LYFSLALRVSVVSSNNQPQGSNFKETVRTLWEELIYLKPSPPRAVIGSGSAAPEVTNHSHEEVEDVPTDENEDALDVGQLMFDTRQHLQIRPIHSNS